MGSACERDTPWAVWRNLDAVIAKDQVFRTRKKSETTSSFPRGSLVYLIFALTDLLSFSPITCPENTNNVAAINESHRKHAVYDSLLDNWRALGAREHP